MYAGLASPATAGRAGQPGDPNRADAALTRCNPIFWPFSVRDLTWSLLLMAQFFKSYLPFQHLLTAHYKLGRIKKDYLSNFGCLSWKSVEARIIFKISSLFRGTHV